MNNLFICSTVYQLIVALQIRTSIYKTCASDIILTDDIKNTEDLSARIRGLNVFDNVIVIKGKGTALESGKLIYVPALFEKKLREHLTCEGNVVLEKKRYDRIFFANIGGMSYRFAKMIAYKNPQTKICMYEEGVSSYSCIFGDVFDRLNAGNWKHNLAFSLLNQIGELYLFNPAILTWKPKCLIMEIPSIPSTEYEILSLLNEIFEYKNIRDSYEEKVIFFEESYVADGDEVDDIGVVKKLEERYGKEQIFVKSHPRNPTNRFEELGYKTNVDKVIPWEVIAMNIDLRDKVLASISSTAVASTLLLLNAKTTLVLEYSELKNMNYRLKKTVEVIEVIKAQYPTVFEELV